MASWLHGYVQKMEILLDTCDPCLNSVAEFFIDMVKVDHLSFGTIRVAHSALQQLFLASNRVLSHPLIKCLMLGFAQARPPQPSLKSFIWDLNTVLKFCNVDNNALNLTDLSRKALMLLLLQTMVCHATVTLLSIDHMEVSDDCLTFEVQGFRKSNRAQCPNPTVAVCESFPVQH